MQTLDQVSEQLAQAERIWLFLDYDGTLADFAPTPEHVHPDAELIDLMIRLNAHPRLRVAIVSGRALPQLQTLLPVPGLLLAGTYGIEIQMPGGDILSRAAFTTIRPMLDQLKPRWSALVTGRQGYFLEDKGWAMALHARFAADTEALDVLRAAQYAASIAVASSDLRMLYGHKFVEVGPKLAHKGYAVSYLLEHFAWGGALPVYIGDDDKDEEAFEVINQCDGLSLVVSASPRQTRAAAYLQSPQAVRCWLANLLEV